MSKLNKRTSAPKPRTAQHVIQTSARQTGKTALGAPGFGRDLRSELYLLGVTNMVKENTFHESAQARDDRWVSLIRQAAVAYPEWTLEFLRWLRQGAGMRSASIIGVAEFIKGRLDAQAVDEPHYTAHLEGNGYPPKGINRRIVGEVLVRPDEPADVINYWMSNYGHNIPMPLKRGVADATANLYNQWSFLRYDSDGDEVRFADVLELTHPVPSVERWDEQGALYKHALDDRHNHVTEIDQSKLPMIYQNFAVKAVAETGTFGLGQLLDTDTIKAAGLSWQNVLSMAGNRVDKAKLWEAVIPTMGYQALLMNLRNFDQAGVSNAVAADVIARLTDPYQVARSRMLPMQFLSAYRAVSSLRWSQALNTALELSLDNIPVLSGRTLILIDTSFSMHSGFSKDGTLMRWDAAAIFGLALAKRCEHADVVSFSGTTMVFPQIKGEALLVGLKRFKDKGFFIGGGTLTAAAVRAHFADHDRVVVLTDEQAQSWGGGEVDPSTVFVGVVPATTPAYTWNLAGYKMAHAPGGPNRHSFGGLTDAAFKMIPLLESNRDGHWPWEMAA